MKTAWFFILLLAATACSVLIVENARGQSAENPYWLVSGISRATLARSGKGEESVDPTELANAIASHEQNADRAAMLFAIAVHESSLRARIARGECGPHECDRDSKTKEVRAWGLWQQWKNAINLKDWGNPSLDVQAKWAARLLRGSWQRCAGYPGVDGPRGAIRAYAGRGCDMALRGEEERLATYYWARRFF